MTTYGFTLQLEGGDEDGHEALSDQLYHKATDCTASFRGGVAYAGFDRDAASLRDTVLSVIESVRSAAPSVIVVGVELDDGQPLDVLLNARKPEERLSPRENDEGGG